jgi:hypothetical protein
MMNQEQAANLAGRDWTVSHSLSEIASIKQNVPAGGGGAQKIFTTCYGKNKINTEIVMGVYMAHRFLPRKNYVEMGIYVAQEICNYSTIVPSISTGTTLNFAKSVFPTKKMGIKSMRYGMQINYVMKLLQKVILPRGKQKQ